MKVRFRCPQCDSPARFDLLPGPPPLWECPACAHRQELSLPAEPSTLSTCVICGNAEIYKKKNFPHWLGLTILTVACLGFLALMAQYEWRWAWALLLGSAAFDGLLYLAVGDVLVCYRCAAHYYQIPPGPEHKPFELGIQERYRQERLRREQLNQ